MAMCDADRRWHARSTNIWGPPPEIFYRAGCEAAKLVVCPPRMQNSVRTLAIPQQAVDLLVEEHKKHANPP